MLTPEQILQDPEFNKLPLADRRNVLSTADPEFGKLAAADQDAVLGRAQEHYQSIAGQGFFGSALQALNPIPALSAPFKAISSMSGRPLYEAFVEPQVEQFRKAGEQVKRAAGGDISGVPGAVMYGAAGLLPGYGPAITRAVEQERAGNLPGALGTMTGTAALPAMGEGFAKLTGKISGEPVYKTVVKPSTKLPQATREAVTERGLRLETEASPKGMKEAQRRIERNKAKVEQLTSPQVPTGQRTIRNATVLEPLDEKIAQYERSNDPTAAEPLKTLRDEWVNRHGGEHGFVTVAEAQRLKQATDAVLKDVVYAEGAKPTGRALGSKLLAKGERGAVEKQVPEVKVPNRAQYLDINLREAINSAMKRDPSWLDHYGRYILAGETLAGGTALLTGHPIGAAMAGGSALATLMIRKAVQDPAAMTRLAFALERVGTKLPPAVRAISQAAPAATLGPATAERKLPDLPPSQLER
jgi:hypothetical protein